MTRVRHFILAIMAASLAWPASAQVLSVASLKGAYNFRYLGLLTFPTNSARSMQGTITFDGNGSFTVTAQAASAAGNVTPLTSGEYYVTGGGLLQMTNPLDTTRSTVLYGGVANGAIVASSTDSDYSDTFVAFPVATSTSNATLNGLYRVAHLEFLNGSLTQTRNTFFSMTANGAGSLGNVRIDGTSQNLRGAPTTQTSNGVTYTVTANGSGTLTVPAPSGVTAANTLLSGSKTLYVSSDGNLFVAGTANGYDMVIGIKAYTGNSPGGSFSGLYFNTLLQNYDDSPDSGGGFYAADGSSNMVSGSSPVELGHQRTFWEYYGTYDYTFAFPFSLNSDGTAVNDFAGYALGANGNFLIGSGGNNNYQLVLYAKAPAVSGTGVFLNPQAAWNTASYIPFTAQIAPGEFLNLYGTGMAAGTATATAFPFPTSLGGVSVTINDIAVPLYFVSPERISLIVPFNSPVNGSLLKIQVTSAGTKSNVGEYYSGNTAPALFTLTQNGLGNGAIRHSDFTVVNSSNPAKAGETVQIYLSGLGTVNSNVAAGAAAPTNPLATLANPLFGIYIDGISAPISFQGLAPQLAGLYQVNVTIPAGLTAGDALLDIETVDASNLQATIPIGK